MIIIAKVNGAVTDLNKAVMKVLYSMPNDEYLKTGKETMNTTTVPFLKKLEYSLKGKKFILGDHIVYADFALFEISDTLRHYDIEILGEYPNIMAHNVAVREIPAIKV